MTAFLGIQCMPLHNLVRNSLLVMLACFLTLSKGRGYGFKLKSSNALLKQFSSSLPPVGCRTTPLGMQCFLHDYIYDNDTYLQMVRRFVYKRSIQRLQYLGELASYSNDIRLLRRPS